MPNRFQININNYETYRDSLAKIIEHLNNANDFPGPYFYRNGYAVDSNSIDFNKEIILGLQSRAFQEWVEKDRFVEVSIHDNSPDKPLLTVTLLRSSLYVTEIRVGQDSLLIKNQFISQQGLEEKYSSVPEGLMPALDKFQPDDEFNFSDWYGLGRTDWHFLGDGYKPILWNLQFWEETKEGFANIKRERIKQMNDVTYQEIESIIERPYIERFFVYVAEAIRFTSTFYNLCDSGEPIEQLWKKFFIKWSKRSASVVASATLIMGQENVICTPNSHRESGELWKASMKKVEKQVRKQNKVDPQEKGKNTNLSGG